MKKLILTACLLSACTFVSHAKDIKGTYNGTSTSGNKIIIKCKNSKYVCVTISRVDENDPVSPMTARVYQPDGSIVNEYMISDYSEVDAGDGSTDVELLP